MAKKPRSYKPVSGFVLPRFAGIATFMRLPHVPLEDLAEAGDVDIGLIGVPWDGGTTNRAGARHGPRQIRDLSTMVRNVHHVSGISPFTLANCADLGDTPCNPIDLHESIAKIEGFYTEVHKAGVLPLSAGGTISSRCRSCVPSPGSGPSAWCTSTPTPTPTTATSANTN
jgi:guanidinopropionase